MLTFSTNVTSERLVTFMKSENTGMVYLKIAHKQSKIGQIYSCGIWRFFIVKKLWLFVIWLSINDGF